MGPSRSFWNGTTSALQPEEITSKGTEFHVGTINKSAHTKKVWKVIVCTSYNGRYAIKTQPDQILCTLYICIKLICY